VDAIVMKCLRDADVRDEDELMHWKRMLEAQRLLRKTFVRYIETGKISKDQLDERKKTIKQRISRFKYG
jgi:hypothetical protein